MTSPLPPSGAPRLVSQPVPSRLPHRLMAAIMVLGALGSAGAVTGHLRMVRLESAVDAMELEREQANRLLRTLLLAETGLHHYLTHDRMEGMRRFLDATALLETAQSQAARQRVLLDAAPGAVEKQALEDFVRHLLLVRHRLLSQPDMAIWLPDGEAERMAILAHAAVQRFVDDSRVWLQRETARLHLWQDGVLALVLGSALLAGVGLMLAWAMVRRAIARAETQEAALARRTEELQALLRMNETLQACQTRADVEQVVAHTAAQVLAGVPGSLYLYPAEQREMLERAAHWEGPPEGPAAMEALHCWGVKRGRAHLCGQGMGCSEAGCAGETLCLPVAARGELFGMLRFALPNALAEGAPGRHQRRIAEALADGVALSLANITLREKLRAEAMRDSLTGLYNRRFLEEIAPAFLRQVERRGADLCVALLDIDHFKQVNDGFGHAVGDAVLRRAAGLLHATLRRSDICCRYGGEEFLLLLPDCDIGAAFEKLEALRERVAELHESADTALPPITASFGLAQVPAGATSLEDSIRQADEALYAAKQSGRNRVVSAPLLARLRALQATAAPDRPGG